MAEKDETKVNMETQPSALKGGRKFFFSGQEEAGQKKEAPKQEEEKMNAFIDDLVENYVDERQNLFEHKESIFGAAFEVENILSDRWNDLVEKHFETEEYNDPFDFYNNTLFLQEIKKRLLDYNIDQRRKIILLRIYNDSQMAGIMEDMYEPKTEPLEKIMENPETPFLTRAFAEHSASNLVQSYVSPYYTESYEDDPEWRKFLNKKTSYYDFHNSNFNCFNLELSPEMTVKINEERGDDHFYKKLFHVKMVEDADSPWGETCEGDYITAQLAPDLVGVYGRNGTLVGWHEITAEMKKRINQEESPSSVDLSTGRLSMKEVDDSKGMSFNNRLDFKDPKEDIFFFKLLLSLPIRNEIKEEFGVDIATLNLRIQHSFLNYLKNKNVQEFEELKNFLNGSINQEAKTNRVRSFLSLEQDSLMGEKIISIGKKFPPEIADRIFGKYAEIADLAFQEEEEMRNLAEKEKIKGVNFHQIGEALLFRARKLLLDFSQEIPEKNISKEEQEKLGRKIIEKLELIPANIILSAEVFNAALLAQLEDLEDKESFQDINLEDLSQSKFSRLTVKEFSETDNNTAISRQIETIYRKNYKKRPLLRDALVASLKSKIEAMGEDTELDIYELHEKVVAACRFDKRADGSFYFASMNVHPEILRRSIGGIFMDRVPCGKTKEGDVFAECIPSEDISSWYIRRQGFVVDKIVDDYKEYGEDFIFQIRRQQEQPEYKFKKNILRRGEKKQEMIPAEEIIESFISQGSEEKDGKIIFQFPIKKQVSPDMYPQEMKDALKKYINEKGYVMTGYFFDANNNAYCALEAPGRESGANSSSVLA